LYLWNVQQQVVLHVAFINGPSAVYFEVRQSAIQVFSPSQSVYTCTCTRSSIKIKVSSCIFIIKPTRCANFPNLLRHETLHVSGSSSAHRQEFIHCTLGTGICHTGSKTSFEQDQDGTAFPSWSCSSKFGKLLYLFGFIIKEKVSRCVRLIGNYLVFNISWLR
jgi:hypothetical protein